MFGRSSCASRADSRDVLSALQHTESALTSDPRAAVIHAAPAQKPDALDYGIHFHVWGAAELVELVATLQRFAQFELELFRRNG
jgi:hypothetical protein